ncbi:MAG TPA: hypothetical protein VL175_04505 [Pirellulales bacterium]|jgi:hypothetical protein|nr:hypothetical protein [Pirellulales bacterium]
MLRSSKVALARLALALVVLSSAACVGAQDLGEVPPQFERLGGATRELRFARGEQVVPAGGHFQGIQLRFDAARNRYLAFLSHDSLTVGYLAVVEFPEALERAGQLLAIHEFPSDGQTPPLRHAGGMQLCGNILAVGLEDNQQKTRSQVQFWDVVDPLKPAQLAHLTIKRAGAPKEKTAGAVGIIERERDHLVVVANWDSRDIDFYVSNNRPLADRDCRFELVQHWAAKAAVASDWRPNDRFGAYQAINLVTSGERLFMTAFETRMSVGDIVDMFAIDLGADATRLLTKIGSKSVSLSPGVHFQAAAGLSASSDAWTLLAAPHAFTPEVIMDLVR